MIDGRLTRSQFLTGLGVAGVAALLPGCGGGGSPALTGPDRPHLTKGGRLGIYSWPQYFAQANLDGFTRATGTKVSVATYESNDTMFAKLRTTGGGGFDLAIPSGSYVPVLAGKGLLAKLDHDRLPLQHLAPSLMARNFDRDNMWSIPKDYGVNGVVYDPVAVGGTIVSWQDVLDAATRPGVSGRVNGGTGSAEMLGMGLWTAGKDLNTTDPAAIRRAFSTMKGFSRHCREFNGGHDVAELTAGTIVMAMVDQATARQAIQQNPKLRFAIPTPHSELWIDCYTILAKAPDPNQAYSFLDWQLQPDHQVIDTEYIGYPTALPDLRRRLPASVPLKDDIFVAPEVFERLQTYVVHPAVQPLIDSLYNEITGGSAP
jgi:spermidine/putrescine transport system substrate-binding protein